MPRTWNGIWTVLCTVKYSSVFCLTEWYNLLRQKDDWISKKTPQNHFFPSSLHQVNLAATWDWSEFSQSTRWDVWLGRIIFTLKKKKEKRESTTWKFLWLIKLGIENKLISQLMNGRREPLNLFGAFCLIIQTFRHSWVWEDSREDSSQEDSCCFGSFHSCFSRLLLDNL